MLPLKRWLRMCSKIAAKLTNSSDESSMGSAVYFSRSVFTENLKRGEERDRGMRNKQDNYVRICETIIYAIKMQVAKRYSMLKVKKSCKKQQ